MQRAVGAGNTPVCNLQLVPASHLTASAPVKIMPRLAPLRSKDAVRIAMSIIAPKSRLVAGARRRSAMELEELRSEAKVDKSEADSPAVGDLRWTSPLSALQYPDPRLRAPNARLSASAFGPQLRRLADEMFELMYQDDGVGLAAPQVGVNVRLMVFNAEGVRGAGEELILANPRIVSTSSDTDVQQEGCLSFRKLNSKELLLGDVKRSLRLKVQAQDEDGHPFVRTLKDWPARIFQHEYDHLQGTLFPDRIAKIARAHMLPELQRLEADFLTRHPGEQVSRYS